MIPRIFLPLLTAITIVSAGCNSDNLDISTLPKDIRQVLNLAGSNKKALVAVISHYSGKPADSLKLKAAFFLIRNLPRWYYYQSRLLTKLQDYYGSIRQEGFSRSFTQTYVDSAIGRFYYEKQEVKFDLQTIQARELIDNVDLAFKVWNQQPWSKLYNFDQFCRFVLPYRIGDEQPDNDRNRFWRKFHDALPANAGRTPDAVAACTAVNSELMKEGWYLFIGSGYLPHFPALKLLKCRSGDCREESDFGLYVMRSLGIPVSIDFIPQWPFRSMGHSFNAVIGQDGKPVMFEAGINNPGFSRFAGCKMGKVYRNTFEYNDSSLAAISEGQETVPELFENPYFVDVTDQYVPCVDVKLAVPKAIQTQYRKNFAYICVFDDKKWVPINWGKIERDSVKYSRMEAGIVYLTGLYDGHGIVPFGDPFVLESDGRITRLNITGATCVGMMTIRKIFPALLQKLIQLDGAFQGANDPDFADAIDLFDLRSHSEPQWYWNRIDLRRVDSFRYFRYYRPYYCSIGDMSFYSGSRLLMGSLLSSHQNGSLGKYFPSSMVVDGDPATSFIAIDKKNEDDWVGVDVGRPVRVDSIVFSPGIDLNGPACFVKTGDTYELRCWSDNHWKVLGSSLAVNGVVSFPTPSGRSLFWVHNITHKTEERIFTWDNGHQVFW